MSGHTVQTIATYNLLLSNANCYIIFECKDKYPSIDNRHWVWLRHQHPCIPSKL